MRARECTRPVNPNDELPPILIVDDTEDDVFFLKRVLRQMGVRNRCLMFTDGAEVLTYLKGISAMARRDGPPLPALVFLDLHMPCVTGLEVLQWMHEEPVLRDLPVVVLSTSTRDLDRAASLARGAAAYLVKHATAAEIVAVLGALRENRSISIQQFE
jgi:CheY-like chemotaxis protein